VQYEANREKSQADSKNGNKRNGYTLGAVEEIAGRKFLN
jgi:hypothetical protein